MGHGKHHLLVRVYYEDTDAGGFVYHANYLKFAERARTEMLRQFGIEHGKILKNHGVGFVVRACNMQFFKPGLLDDLLLVDSEVLVLNGVIDDDGVCANTELEFPPARPHESLLDVRHKSRCAAQTSSDLIQ